MPTTVADVLVEELKVRGVSFVAVLNGHGLDPFLLACQKAALRVIDVRNEQAAGYMAEVTGRLTGTVGVCAVSGGVAHVNAMTGVLDAALDGAPMLLITGITAQTELDWGNFQDFNPVPLAAPICKYARIVDVPHRVAQITHEAFVAATSGRPGPVHLALPMDTAATPVNSQDLLVSKTRTGQVQPSGSGDTPNIEYAARLLAAAKQPVLIAGSGARYANAGPAAADLASQLKMPLVVPIWDRGCIEKPCEEFMGVIGAASGGPRILADADLLILAGAEFDYRVGQTCAPAIRDDAKVIRIHTDPTRLRQGLEADLSIQGSPKSVLQQLRTACANHASDRTDEWLTEVRRRRNDFQQGCLQRATTLPEGINGLDVVKEVTQIVHTEGVLLVDGGNIGQWFHQLLSNQYPSRWVTCGASGVVGWGLPGAVAARAIHPDGPVVLLSGDGSFTFTVGELECAARQGLPFVAVVADDEQWGISVTGHIAQFGKPLFSELGPTRFDLVAQGFGCDGVQIADKEELGPALRAALTADRPTVLHVPIVPSSPADNSI